MKKRWIVIMYLLALVSTTGCVSSREIEHMLYVNSIGIDYVDGKINFYVQFLSFSNISKMESGARNPEIIAIGKGSGKTLEEAVFNLYESTQQRLAWSQVKSIILTKEALKHPWIVKEWLDEKERYYEFRNTVWMFGTNQNLEDLLNTKTVLNISSLYSRISDPKDMYSQNSDVKPLYLYEFNREWNESGRTILLPVLSISREGWTENRKPHPAFEISGIFSIKNKKYADYIPREEVLGLRWMEEKMKRSAVQFPQYGYIIIEHPHVKITPHIGKGQAAFDILVEAEGYLTILMDKLSQNEIQKRVAKNMENDIRNTYLRGIQKNIDLLQLSHFLYREQPRNWKNLNQNGYLPLTPESLRNIEVKVKLQHSGLKKSRP